MNLLTDIIDLKERARVSTETWYYHHRLINEMCHSLGKLEEENKDLREVVYQLGKRIQKLEGKE